MLRLGEDSTDRIRHASKESSEGFTVHGVGGMSRLIEKWRRYLPRRRRVGCEIAQTLAVASQMALLCPSGVDVWVQREPAGCTDLDRFDSRGP